MLESEGGSQVSTFEYNEQITFYKSKVENGNLIINKH